MGGREEMRALVWDGPGRLSVRATVTPTPQEHWSVVGPAYSGICGSDLHVLAGKHPRARPGAILGHEFVGRVLDGSADLPAGTPVFVNPMLPCRRCLACRAGHAHVCPHMRAIGIDLPGGLAERVLVPDENLHELPRDLWLRDAALIEPVAVAVHGVERARVHAGERVHVVGAGPIGVLAALVARAAGAHVTISEPSSARRSTAARLGLSLSGEPTDEIAADVVFDAAGQPAAAGNLARWARPRGRIVILAAYPPTPPKFDLLGVMFNELTVIGSRIYTEADITRAIDLIAADRLPTNDLITDVVDLDEAPAAFEQLRHGGAMKILVRLGLAGASA